MTAWNDPRIAHGMTAQLAKRLRAPGRRLLWGGASARAWRRRTGWGSSANSIMGNGELEKDTEYQYIQCRDEQWTSNGTLPRSMPT